MNTFDSLINFILKFVTFISQLLKPRADQFQTSVQPPPTTIVVQAEANAAPPPEEHRQESNNHTTTRAQQPPPNNGIQLQWRLLIITICFATVGTAVQALQTIKDVPEHKSIQFHCSRMALALSLAYLTVSVYVRPYFGAAALIFEHVAVFFSAMAFALVLTMVDFPHAVIIVSLAIFVVSLLAVFLATYLWRKLGFGTEPL